MRCLACGAGMILVKVVPDDTMAVAGFEHHTFMCSDCNDIERRLVFSKDGESRQGEGEHLEREHIRGARIEREQIASEDVESTHGEPDAAVNVPMHAAPPIAPAESPVSEQPHAPGLLRRMLARWRRTARTGR